MVKEKGKIDIGDKIAMSIAIILIVSLIFFGGMIVGKSIVDIRLTQKVADDVCRQLTEEPTAVASVDNPTLFNGAKLVCTIPSFDATQNIIVKSNAK